MKNSILRLKILGLVLAVCLLSRPIMLAQEASSGEAARTEQSTSNASHSRAEEAGDDESAQFKHSSSVRWIARHTGLSVEICYWVAVVVNFVVVVSLIPWIIKLIAGRNLKEVFQGRTASIQKSIEEARRASEDAKRRLADVEARLSRMGDEIAEMRAASEKESSAEEERIQKAAEDDARRIVESAEQEIAAATKAARRELTSYAADLAVTLATKQIHVDTATDQGLVRRFASQLGKDGKKA